MEIQVTTHDTTTSRTNQEDQETQNRTALEMHRHITVRVHPYESGALLLRVLRGGVVPFCT